MVFSISTTTTRATSNFFSASPFLINLSAVQHNASFSLSYLKKSSGFTSTSISFSDNRCYTNNNRFGLVRSRAAKHQSSSVKKQAPAPTKKKKNKKRGGGGVGSEGDEDMVEDMDDEASPASYRPSQLPKPPAGFVLDPQGRVIMASSERIATIVDSTNNLPLECIIRRVFRSSRGDECMLLCPVDTPVQILKSTNIEGWSAVSDEEIEAILPAAAYALSKIHMHLVSSGFCYTARGGFCYSEEDIFEFGSDDGQDVDGLPTQGLEITCFHSDGAHYMIYTPSDPLLFVAMKDQNGQLQIADDDLLEDPAIIEAIDEETEFNALVEEEAILLESLIGKR